MRQSALRNWDRPATGALALLVALALGSLLVPLLSRADPLAISDVLALRLLPPLSRDATGHFDFFNGSIAANASGVVVISFTRSGDATTGSAGDAGHYAARL